MFPEEPTLRLPLACGGFALAFAAGLFAADAVPHAWAQATATAARPAMTPGIVNVMTMTEDEIGPMRAGADIRSRTLVDSEHGTIAIQSGNVMKHFHADADEIQLILDGTGSFWLGEREVQVKPGDLVIIPRRTAHAGSRATTGRFRAVAIKLPPQRADDVHPVP